MNAIMSLGVPYNAGEVLGRMWKIMNRFCAPSETGSQFGDHLKKLLAVFGLYAGTQHRSNKPAISSSVQSRVA